MRPLRLFLRDVRLLPSDLKLLAVSLFAWASGESLFIYIAPLYLKQLGASPVQIGNILSLGGFVSAAAMIPAGLLTDRWGAKRVLWFGWLTGLVAGLLMAAASSLAWFAFGWIAYAVTLFVVPAVSSYAVTGRGALLPERALTMTSAAYALGNVISPALAGWIAGQFGLRSLFFVASALFFVSTVVLHFVRTQPLAPAVALRPNFRALFGDRRFIGFCLLMQVVWAIIWLGIPLAPNFLADVRGLSVSVVAALGSVNALGWVLLNLVLGRLQPRRAFMIAQALIMLYLFLLLRASAIGWIALAYAARAAQLTGHSLVNGQATRLVDRSRWGLAFGVLETVGWLGAFVGPLAAGRLYQRSPALPFQVSLALMPVALLLTYLFSPRPAPGDEPAPLPAGLMQGESLPPPVEREWIP